MSFNMGWIFQPESLQAVQIGGEHMLVRCFFLQSVRWLRLSFPFCTGKFPLNCFREIVIILLAFTICQYLSTYKLYLR